jgi:hypothetical protein
LRRARATHRDTSLGAILTDIYVVAFAVAIYGALAAAAIRRHLRLPEAGSPAEKGVRGWLLVAVVLVLGGLAWHAVRDLGPLYVTAAARYWAAGTPVDRAGWLRPAFGWVLLVGAGCGALFGVGITLIGGADVRLVIATTLAGAALPAVAVVAQAKAVPAAAVVVRPPEAVAAVAPRSAFGGRRRSAPGHGTATVVVGLGLAAALGIVTLDALDISVPLPAFPAPVFAVAAALLAVGTAAAALRRLGRLDAAALTGGAQLADAATVSLVLLQPAMFTDIVEIRRWRRVGRVHSGRLGPPPSFVAGGLRRVWTLVRADLRRQWRRPAGLLAWAALAVVPYAMTLVAPAAAAPARVVAGYLAIGRVSAGLRTVCRSAALRRLLGGSDPVLRFSHLVVPAVALVLWWPSTLPVSRGPGWAEPLLALGVLAAAYRSASRHPTRYDGPAMETPFGIMQPELVTQIVRGPDLVAAVALVAFALR